MRAMAASRSALAASSGFPFTSITWDNGTEFHGYKALEEATGVRCYFAYPHRPWERGSNENFNGLLRQYIPKGACMQHLTQKQCDHIASELNNRPRKRHNFLTPSEVFFGRTSVALAG